MRRENEISMFAMVNALRNFGLLSGALSRVEDLLEKDLEKAKPMTVEELRDFFNSMVPPDEEPYGVDEIAQRINELSQEGEIYDDEEARAFDYPIRIRHAILGISYGYLEVELKRLIRRLREKHGEWERYTSPQRRGLGQRGNAVPTKRWWSHASNVRRHP